MRMKMVSLQLQSNNKFLTKTLECQASSSVPIKGEGCGNTFLIFDCLDESPERVKEIIKEAHPILLRENRDDALILSKESADVGNLILKMTVLEPDGSIAEFCGNGARVVSCYLQKKFVNQKMDFYLKTSRGKRKIWVQDDMYHVEMGRTRFGSNTNKFLNPNLEIFRLGLGMKQFTFYWTETLEPHLVTFDEIGDNELNDLGLYLNLHQRNFFPQGINLNRAEIISKGSLLVTTFERGVNRITAACGTGATSCAMLAKALGRIENAKAIEVVVKGGVIMIYHHRGCAVMAGPAKIGDSI